MTVVFVYGTLKRGGALHHALESSEFLAVGALPNYALHDLGWFPGIVPEEGTLTRGELFRVDEETLADLDQIEGTPSLYRREIVSVVTRLRHTGSRAKSRALYSAHAYIYNGTPLEGNKIISGHWPVDGGEG